MQDIDMKSLTGADLGPAAVDQNQIETNSYQEQTQEYPVKELLNPEPQEQVKEAAADVETNPQAGHFRALREEVDRIKAERETEKKDYQLQIDMLKANLAQKQQPQQEPQPDRIFSGMKDDDVPSVAEFRREWESREAAYQARLEELQVQQLHPDYAEVIEKFAVPLVKQKPHLAEGLQGARNKALFAYELGKMAQQMQQPQAAPVKSEAAQKIVENSRKPATLAQSGGGRSALSQADYFASMSDQEFMKFASRHLESI